MATDPLSLAFIGCFLIGLLFLLITSFSGHSAIHHVGNTGHLHSLHPGGPGSSAHTERSAMQVQQDIQLRQTGSFWLLSYLNPMSLVLFLLGFGFLGYIFHNVMTSLALQFIFAIAVVGGIVLALVFLTLLSRIFGDSEGTTVQDVSDRTGLLGKVSMTIPQQSLGEITYLSPGGMRKSVPARSLDGQRLERDQEVVVVNYQNGIAEVDTWEHFAHQEGIGATEGPPDDPLVTQQALLEQPDSTDEMHITRKESQKE